MNIRKFLIVFLILFATPAFAELYLDGVDQAASGGVSGGITSGLVADLPVAGVAGRLQQVTDGATATDCTVGLGSNFVVCQDTGSAWVAVAGSGTGDVTASASLVDNAVIRGDGGTKGVQDAGILIDDSDNMSAVVSLSMTPGAAPSHAEGLMYYDSTKKAYTYYNDEADVGLNIGQEMYVKVRNTTGTTIANGAVVYMSGVDSGVISITLADADTYDTSRIIGVATHSIENNTNGYVTRFGEVGGLNTSAYVAGDLLYLSSTAGAFTDTAATGGQFPVLIGRVKVVDGAVGVILVDPIVSELSVEVTSTNGFPAAQRTNTTLTFTDGTRTFGIAPVSGNFNYYQDGQKYIKTALDTVVIDNTEGIHLIYYDGATLTANANPTTAETATVIRTKVLVAYVYWDVSGATTLYFADERHDIEMSPATHTYLHFTRGAQYLNGLALGDLSVDQDGSLAAHAQFSVATGFVADEDIVHNISAVTSTTGLPIFYLNGASGTLERVTQAGYSAYNTGSANGRLYYNEWTGSAWQLTEVASGDFVLYHVFAVNGYTGEDMLISIMGQADYLNSVQARAGANDEISNIITAFPFEELVPLATVIYQTNAAYTNTLNARIISTDTGDDYVDWRSTELSPGAGATSHTNLSNLELATTGVDWGHIDDQAQSLYGVKTFGSFPVTPSSPPSTDYQVPNKKYVDDLITDSASLEALLTDETGIGLVVFNVGPNIQDKIVRTGTAVDDDDCTGEQGSWWWDSTDTQFEFCNDSSGAPDTVGIGAAITLDIGDDGGDDSTNVNEIATVNDTNSIVTEDAADKILFDMSANWPTADTANAGDSATAFFSSGNLEVTYLPVTGTWTPTTNLTFAGPLLMTGKITRLGAVVNDDDCGGDQGKWWWDSTDLRFEFCNASSGTPIELTGGTAVILDLADDDSNESNAITEIAVTNDTNSIISEPTADKVLFDMSNNWPTCDTANAGDSATSFFTVGALEVARMPTTGTWDMSGMDLTLDSDVALDTEITYETLNTNGDVGTSAGQLAIGNHTHELVLSPIILAEPDQLQPISDAWPLYHFIAEVYPSGVTITSIHISTSATCTDALNFEEWGQGATSATSTVEAITLSGTHTEDDGTLADASIAADGWLYVDLPATPTDIAFMAITVSFTVN
jgi:hypothetical protein